MLLAIAEVLAANQLRDRIRRRPGALPVQPLVAARMLALAKASAVVGAVMVGIWAGLLVYVVPRLGQLAAAGNDTAIAAFGVVAAVRADARPHCGSSTAAGPRLRRTATGKLGRTDQRSRN